MKMSDTAKCRGCGMTLNGKPYHLGGPFARHPKTGEVCRVNYYGGYVCSESCDQKVISHMEVSIDAHNDPFGYYQNKWKRKR